MVCDAKCKSTARLDGKTAVVTGCNTGIGKFTVCDFYKRGARVIMACRSVEKAQQAEAEIRKECEGEQNLGDIKVVRLDLGSLKSIRECAQQLLDEEEQINLLVNNAGIMACPEGKTEDGFETQMGTNHFGPFLFTVLLLPKIIKSAPARIVNVSSSLHSFVSGPFNLEDLNWETRTYDSIQAYNQSKLANILFTKELAKRLEDAGVEGVTTYSLHPGVVATDLQRHAADGISPAVDWIQRNIARPFFKTPEQGAQTSIYCSVDENCANETGLYYAECKPKTPSSKACNMDDAKILWDISFKMVGLGEEYNPFDTKL